MSNEKMREEFLAAFVAQFGFGRMAASSNADAAGMLACAEWAWFASRAAIEVEITGYDSLLRALYDGVDINDVVEAIKEQGLKVKVTP